MKRGSHPACSQLDCSIMHMTSLNKSKFVWQVYGYKNLPSKLYYAALTEYVCLKTPQKCLILLNQSCNSIFGQGSIEMFICYYFKVFR